MQSCDVARCFLDVSTLQLREAPLNSSTSPATDPTSWWRRNPTRFLCWSFLLHMCGILHYGGVSCFRSRISNISCAERNIYDKIGDLLHDGWGFYTHRTIGSMKLRYLPTVSHAKILNNKSFPGKNYQLPAPIENHPLIVKNKKTRSRAKKSYQLPYYINRNLPEYEKKQQKTPNIRILGFFILWAPPDFTKSSSAARCQSSNLLCGPWLCAGRAVWGTGELQHAHDGFPWDECLVGGFSPTHLKDMRTSNWVHLPQFSGWTLKKCLKPPTGYIYLSWMVDLYGINVG